MSALAQFERNVLADRTREGLAAARARGRKGGRPPADKEQLRKAIKLYSTAQYSLAEIDEMTGIKRSTLYRSITRSKTYEFGEFDFGTSLGKIYSRFAAKNGAALPPFFSSI